LKRSDVLVLIAIWDFLTAIGIFLIVAVVAAVVATLSDSFSDAVRTGLAIAAGVAGTLLLVYCGLSLAAGIGLLMKKEWGRILAIIHAALSLPRIPFGTIIGILAIIYLLTPETKGYFRTDST
jgi:uncharacterized membrane protein (DUF2068 family)